MASPFHYAFFVRDLASTRRFYGEILGCREGRSTETWVDFDFFGNQISAHTTGTVSPTQNTGRVEDILVPMPHFGALLNQRLAGSGVSVLLELPWADHAFDSVPFGPSAQLALHYTQRFFLVTLRQAVIPVPF